MEIAFSESGKQKIACYILTYEERHDPQRWKHIRNDFAQKKAQGYIIGCTYPATPRKPTYDSLVAAMNDLEERCQDWLYHQKRKMALREIEHKEKPMGTTYSLFTEAKVNGKWYCINETVIQLQPTEHPVVVPTLRTNARMSFAKADRELHEDGYSIKLDEVSESLRKTVVEWLNPEYSSILAVPYDKIASQVNATGKEHCAFALRSEVAAYENGESDDIWDFVSVNEYKRMDDELKKAYQYYEWNDLSGTYRYYEAIGQAVTNQLANWKTVNGLEKIDEVRIVMFTN